MQFFLSKASEHLESGLRQQQAGNAEQARRHFLKASEYLFKAAKTSEGELKATRTRQAGELLRRAQALDQTSGAVGDSRRREAVSEGGIEASPWLVAERPRVTFKDVAGLEAVKEQIRLRMVYPFTHPQQAERYGVKSGGGLLLFGPPGTGKTLLARAVAGEIEAAFFTVKPSEIMSKWVGEAEQNIAKLFAAARLHPRSVIFIDEVEALVPKRRSSGSTVMQRVVPQILSEMEGFEEHENALLFVGASNEPWALDTAVLRPGRFDEKIYIPLPDRAARQRILWLNLHDKPLAPEVDLVQLADLMQGYSGADIVHICEKARDIPFIEAVKTGQEREITLADFLTVLQETRPSVNPKDLRKFEAFAQGK